MSLNYKALILAGLAMLHLNASAQKLHLSKQRIRELDSLRKEQNRLWEKAARAREERCAKYLARAKHASGQEKKRQEIYERIRKKEAAGKRAANRLTTFPPQILALTQLTELNLADNLIRTFPAKISNLKNLHFIYLEGNHTDMTSPEYEKLKIALKEFNDRGVGIRFDYPDGNEE